MNKRFTLIGLLLVVLLLCSVPARAQVVFDANATASCTSNGVTTKDCATLTVGGGANRALVCAVIWSATNGGVTVANWDQLGTPQAMTAITGATATNTSVVQLYGLVNPTAGAKTVRFTWTTARDVYVNCTSFTGVDQTGGTTTFPHGNGATGTATVSSVPITSATNNAIVAVHGTTDSFTSVSGTQTFLNNVAAGVSGAGNRTAGTASVAMTATKISNAIFASAGTDILAAGGGGGVVCGARALIGVGC